MTATPNHSHTVGRENHRSATSTKGVTHRACNAVFRIGVGMVHAVRSLPKRVVLDRLSVGMICDDETLFNQILNQAHDVRLDGRPINGELVRDAADDGSKVFSSLQQLPHSGTGFVQSKVDACR